MDYLKELQTKKNYRKILASEYVQAIERGILKKGQNCRLGQIFLMPQTFSGSRQFYQKKYADLMTMVRAIGNPTWLLLSFFITPTVAYCTLVLLSWPSFSLG